MARIPALALAMTMGLTAALGAPMPHETASPPNQIVHEKSDGATIIEHPVVNFGGASYPVGFSTYATNDEAEQQRHRELTSLCLRFDVQAKHTTIETETIPAGQKVAVMEVAARHPTGRVARVDTAMTIDGHKPEIVTRVKCQTALAE